MKRSKKTAGILMLIMSFAIVCLSFGVFSFDFKNKSQAEENVAKAVSANGGAMYIGAGSTVTLDSDCTISSVTGATRGGAIYVAGTLNIEGATIISCSAEYGGAIYVADGGVVNMNSGTLEDCTASQGGAVFVSSSGRFVFNDGDIFDCTAGQGGGIYNNSVSSSMSGGSIRECSASSTVGGGIYTNAAFSLTGDAYIGDCSAEIEGGGIYSSSGSLMLTGSSVKIYSCSADYRGGGIYKNGSHLLLASSGIIEHCTANEGGGVYATSDSSVALQGTFSIENCSAQNGGGLWMTETDFSMTGGSFSECSAEGGCGGAIYNDYFGTINITGGSFVDCFAYSPNMYGGGAIYSYSSYEFTIQGTSSNKVLFQGCYASGQGAIAGAIFMGAEESGATHVIEYATFDSCSAESSGGALSFEIVPDVTISHTAFNGCSADEDGGAIWTWDSASVSLENGTSFSNCEANNGGAIYCGNYMDLDIVDATFVSCMALNGSGGGIFVESIGRLSMHSGEDSSLSMLGCGAYSYGGGIYIEDSGSYNPTLYNVSISECSADYGGGIYVSDGKTLNLYGGDLTENLANTEGGNIYLSMDAYLNLYDGIEILNGYATNGDGGNISAYGQNEITLYNGTIEVSDTGDGYNMYFIDRVYFYLRGGTVGSSQEYGRDCIVGDGADVYIEYYAGKLYSDLKFPGILTLYSKRPENVITLSDTYIQVYSSTTSYLNVADYKSGVSGYSPVKSGNYIALVASTTYTITVNKSGSGGALYVDGKIQSKTAASYSVQGGSTLVFSMSLNGQVGLAAPEGTLYTQYAYRIKNSSGKQLSGNVNRTSSSKTYTYTYTVTKSESITVEFYTLDGQTGTLFIPEEMEENKEQKEQDIYFDDKKFLLKNKNVYMISQDLYNQEKYVVNANRMEIA